MYNWQPFPLASNFGGARSRHTSLESLTNLFAQPNPEGSNHPFTLYGTPGLKLWTTPASGMVRGMIWLNPYIYAVVGDRLYTISSSKATTDIGEIKGSGQVYMTANRTHIGIATQDKLYAANAAGGVTGLPESGMSGATYQDGYGIFSQANTEQFYVTDLDDMTTIGGSSFSSADVFADNLITCRSHNRELWLFGQWTIEIWGLTAATFPFTRTAGGNLDLGCGAAGSVAGGRNSLFFLGNDNVVYQTQGYSPVPISPPWIVHEIEKESSPQSATSFVHQFEGHVFYVLTFPGRTLVYDMTTGMWHKRKSQGIGRWRANCYITAFGKHLVGDYENGKIYELDQETYDEDGAELRAEAILPPVGSPGMQRLKLESLRLDMQRGVGLESGQGSDPQVILDWTDDDRQDWSNELWRSMGQVGQVNKLVQWNRLGAFRQRTLRIAITDPVKREIHGLHAAIGVL